MKQQHPKPLKNKPKKYKQKLEDRFRQQNVRQFKKQPSAYILSSIKDKSVTIDINTFQYEDINSFCLLLKMGIAKLHILSKQSTNFNKDSNIYNVPFKFKQFLKRIASTLQNSSTLKSLTIQKIPLQMSHLQIFTKSIALTPSLKQLCLIQCALTDAHLQILTKSLSQNESLVFLDLSANKLKQVGKTVGKIIKKHSGRRDDMILMASLRGESVDEQLSKKGICDVNLASNLIGDRNVWELMECLKDDQWLRCLNLQNNQLGAEAVREFAKLMKKNSTLVSLDLRGNSGLTKEYWAYISKKLKSNIDKYKDEKKQSQNKKQNQSELLGDVKNNQHKSMEQRKQQNYKKGQTTILQFSMNKNNITSVPQIIKSHKSLTEHCSKCRQKTLQNLKLQQKNLDLQLQIQRLKKYLLTRNSDISDIMPHHSPVHAQHLQESLVMNRTHTNEGEQDLIGRVENIMSQLTRIMDNMEQQQITQISVSQTNLSNVNSFSNTIPLFATHPSEMDQLEELEETIIQAKETEEPVDRNGNSNSNSERFIN